METKTIWVRADYASDFDSEVNTAMTQGWKLTKREMFRSQAECKHSMLYAELVKLSEEELNPTPATPTWEEAVEVLVNLCAARETCSGCPAIKWCNAVITEDAPAPAEWPNYYQEAEA